MSDFEINVFYDDGALHIKTILPQLVDQEGIPLEPDPTRAAAFVSLLTAAMTATGHTAGRGAQGWGGKGGGGKQEKPETPCPEDLADICPDHDDEPMKYEPAYKNPRTGNQVGAKFVCRKGENCTQSSNYGGKKYGFSIWEDAFRKQHGRQI